MSAQTVPEPTANVYCTFADGKEISLRYDPGSVGSKDKLPNGKVWTPGNSPMDLFTEVDVSLGNADIPVGAYSVYLIPDKKTWSLIVNKNVAADRKYDEKQDMVRVPMEMGQLSTMVDFKASFVHSAPKECNLRIYYGKVGYWAEFKEK